MFTNKRGYQYDQISKWIKNGKEASKTRLAKKLGITRQNLYRILKKYEDSNFFKYGRDYANNCISNEIRVKIFNKLIKFLNNINAHRQETTFVPTFVTLKPYIDADNVMSRRSFEEIIKKNNFYLPSCTRKTKKDIHKRIKDLKKKPEHIGIIEEMEEMKIQKKYVRKYYDFGDTVELDACEHPWYGDEKCHLYRAVDAGTGLVFVEHVEKEETSMGYIILLKKLLKKHGKPRLVVTDKRKSFWNGFENKSQISIILNAIDITIITSSDPTAKPNVERSFHDSQQWLPLELFHRKIFTMEAFNANIDSLTAAHNKRFNKKPQIKSVFRAISDKEIEENLRLWIYRTATSGNTVSIGSEHYIPVKNGKRVLFKDRAKIQIFSDETIKFFIVWQGEKIKLEVLEEKYVVDYTSKAFSKLEFERRKQISFNRMLDVKQIKLEKKEKELRALLKIINDEKEQINAL